MPLNGHVLGTRHSLVSYNTNGGYCQEQKVQGYFDSCGFTLTCSRNRLGNSMSTNESKGQVELNGIIYGWSYKYHIALMGS
jgi:hypothetical protein